MLPFTSVKVNVTVFAPVLAHVNEFGETEGKINIATLYEGRDKQTI
jgi:hypothetical protein